MHQKLSNQKYEYEAIQNKYISYVYLCSFIFWSVVILFDCIVVAILLSVKG